MDCAHLEWASNWNTMKCTGCSKTRNEIDLEAKLSALMVEYDQLLSDFFVKTAELKDIILSMRCCGTCKHSHIAYEHLCCMKRLCSYGHGVDLNQKCDIDKWEWNKREEKNRL